MKHPTNLHEQEKLLAIELRKRQIQFAQRLLPFLFWVTLLLSAIMTGIGLVFPSYTQLLAYGGAVALVTLGTRIYNFFSQINKEGWGLHFFFTTLVLAMGLLPFLMPEILPGATIGYITIILMSNLLLGNKNSLAVAGACLIAYLLDALLAPELSPTWFVPLSPDLSTPISIFVNSFCLIMASIVAYQIFSSQEKTFCQFQRANWEIERRIAEEQMQRDRLQNTVQTYADTVRQVAQGNLSSRVQLEILQDLDSNPLTILGRSLNEMTTSLQAMAMRIRDAAINLHSGASEILATATEQAAGAANQSTAISQATLTVDQIKYMTAQTSTRAREVANVAQHTVEVSQSGQQAVFEILNSMQQIQERVEGIAENILILSRWTQQIEEIITTVNEIATQSNILALNAAVEAARAGEQGLGFAAVALEVRTLAEQSRQATAQIRAILLEIQRATNQTVMVTEEGSKCVNDGIERVAQAQDAIQQLSTVIQASVQAAAQVVESGQQQVSGMEQIVQAMQHINQATLQNMASTRQAEKMAQTMAELARSLTATVSQYRL